MRGPCSWVQSEFWLQPQLVKEGVDSPWVSLLGPTFGYLCQFWFLNICVFSCRVSATGMEAKDTGLEHRPGGGNGAGGGNSL
jgi:hypothetical protein